MIERFFRDKLSSTAFAVIILENARWQYEIFNDRSYESYEKKKKKEK